MKMKIIKQHLKLFTRFEISLWLFSIVTLVLAFLVSGTNYFNLATSLIGVTALIYLAKGEPIGQVLSALFSIVYAIASYTFNYYGEMITYLAMTLPSSLFATYIWFRHPHKKGATQVQIVPLNLRKILFIMLVSPLVTLAFYFVLKSLVTPNLIFSTISIATSIVASLLTFFRSRYYALAYALNDIILIVLWSLAASVNISYLPLVICFVIFLINDLYAFYNWKRLADKQNTHTIIKEYNHE